MQHVIETNTSFTTAVAAPDTATYTAGSVWDSFPSLADIIGTLGTAGLARAAYEINRPALKDPAVQSSGLLGKVGTVGVELGKETQMLLWIALVAAVGVSAYFLLKK